MSSKSIRIKFFSYDHKILDKVVKSVIMTIYKSGIKVLGPISMPTSLSKYVVNNSHHIYKRSKFTMERSTHCRLIIIENPTTELISILNEMTIDQMVYTSIRESKKLKA